MPIFASNTEIVAGVGAADRIVGIEAWTRFPPEVLDRPRIGGRLGFSVEAIAKLRADLVIVTPARQAANQVAQAARADRRSRDRAAARRRAAGAEEHRARRLRAGRGDEKAQALLDTMKARLDRVAEALKDHPPKRVYLETGSNDRGGFQSVRDGSYSADIP